MLGDIVFVEMPEKGKSVEKEGQAGVVESTKAASDVYTPITGEIIETNQNIVDDPAAINKDPEGAAWFFKIKIKNQNILLSKFVLFSLESEEIQKKIKNLSQSSSMPALNFISMKKLKIPCPTINIQKKIIEEIEKEKQLVLRLNETIKKYNYKINTKIDSLWKN